MKTPLLVTTDWLAGHLPVVRVIDCRWVLGRPGEGKREYELGHIPGAYHLDIDQHLAGRSGPGRHPLPREEDFEKIMASIGVTPETHVVAYDAGQGMPAPRLWWLLRYFGHERVSVLDGGWKLWIKEGRASESGPSPLTALPVPSGHPPRQAGESPSPAGGRGWTAVSRPGEGPVVDKKYIFKKFRDPDIILIDARAPERYRGDVEPIDQRAGHIPGAVNMPFRECVDEEGSYRLPSPLGGRGVGGEGKEIICYCGSGVTACTDIFALKLAGIDAKLYEGSWSDWSADPDLPVATGKQP